MDKNTKIYWSNALWVALIPLLALIGSGARVIEKWAIRSLLDPSPKKSQGDSALRRRECRDMTGFAVPLKCSCSPGDYADD
jgi:hypothetical protein